MAERERRVREEEEAVARGAHRVIPDPEGDTPPTDVEGRSPSKKRASGEGGEAGQAGESNAGWRSGELGKQRGRYSPAAPAQSQRRRTEAVCTASGEEGAGTVRWWRAGNVAELVRYVKWAGRTRGGQGGRGIRPFCDLVCEAGRPRDQGPEMEEGRWKRMLGEGLPGVDLECPKERGRKPRVRMLRQLLRREGWY